MKLCAVLLALLAIAAEATAASQEISGDNELAANRKLLAPFLDPATGNIVDAPTLPRDRKTVGRKFFDAFFELFTELLEPTGELLKEGFEAAGDIVAAALD